MSDIPKNDSREKSKNKGRPKMDSKKKRYTVSKRGGKPPDKSSKATATKGKSAFRFNKKTPLASQDYLIPREFVTPCDDTLSIMSTAAKGTTVRIDSTMCVDAGNLPVALAKEVKLLMVTHGHADHMKDVCNAFHDRDGKTLIMFCPAIMAYNLFSTIRNTYSANKGRQYSVAEIMNHLEIYAVVRPNDDLFDNLTHVVDPASDIPIVTLVQVGDLVEIDLGGRAKCAVRPFHCHHTVDTVGYGIYDSTRRLNRTVKIPAGTVIEITPPKMTKADKKAYKSAKAAAVAQARADGTEVPDINLLLNRVNFDTVDAFCTDLEIPDDVITKTIVSCEMDNGFTLDSIRRIEFVADVEFDCFDGDDCALPRSAFLFFKEYEIDWHDKIMLDAYHQALTPKVMVFGDTAASVFSQRLVRDMIGEFPRVVIESTFLDGENILSTKGGAPADDPDLGDDGWCAGAGASAGAAHVKKVKNAKRNLYLRLKDKKHIFLPELFHLFASHPDTEFVLMHFSDRYDRESVMAKGDEVRTRYPNTFFAV